MSADTVFLTRAEVGLTHWDDYTRKPPYSEQDYQDAYNNGLNMAAAFKAANDAGASKVILERGNYPVCYEQRTGLPTQHRPHALIQDTNNLTIEFNNSCVFVIFDSVNKNPYHTSPDTLAYQLPGIVFALKNNTDLKIQGLNLRGDQYNRTWVTGEEVTEQTYGIYFLRNNIRTEIDIVGHGFRGDVISGASKDFEKLLTMRDDWEKGALSTDTGLPISLTGAYKTPKVDINDFTIYRNAIQIVSAGFIKTVQFRDDRFDVFFFDQDNKFISYESSYQTDFIYLPTNCRYVQVVIYGDERDDEMVGYGISVWIASGSSEHCLIKGEYFANHRGAISNLCGYTTVDANIHDNGTLKYGFPHYTNSTRYGINFEDLYSNTLTVRGTIKKGIQGVLFNGRRLDVQCEIRDISVTAIGVYSTTEVNVSESILENIKYNIFEYNGDLSFSRTPAVYNLSNNTIKKSSFNGRYKSTTTKALLNVHNNTFVDCAINLEGNGDNIIWDNNTQLSVIEDMTNTASVSHALRASNNTITVNESRFITRGQGLNLNAKQSSGNTLYTNVEGNFFGDYTSSVPGVLGKVINGLEFNNTKPVDIQSTVKPVDDETPKVIKIDDCKFLGAYPRIGVVYSRPRFSDLDIRISNTLFRGGSLDNPNTYALNLSIRETESTGVHKLVVRDSVIDVTHCKYLLGVPYKINGVLDVKFVNCTFTSDTPKTIRFIHSFDSLANITARAIGCKFVNVVNGK